MGPGVIGVTVDIVVVDNVVVVVVVIVMVVVVERQFFLQFHFSGTVTESSPRGSRAKFRC